MYTLSSQMLETVIGYTFFFVQLYSVFTVLKFFTLKFGYRLLKLVTKFIFYVAPETSDVKHLYSTNNFHHYMYKNHEFILVDGDGPPVQSDLDVVVHHKNDILLVTECIRDSRRDITTEFRKFMHYFREKDCTWSMVLEYCKIHPDAYIQIYYNDDDFSMKSVGVCDISHESEFDVFLTSCLSENSLAAS
jgi:hypothetical protein